MARAFSDLSEDEFKKFIEELAELSMKFINDCLAIADKFDVDKNTTMIKQADTLFKLALMSDFTKFSLEESEVMK